MGEGAGIGRERRFCRDGVGRLGVWCRPPFEESMI